MNNGGIIMVKEKNDSTRYYTMLNEGAWHDHPSNGNWKAWCYLMSSVYRFYALSYKFFYDDSQESNVIKKFLESDEFWTMCTGEKTLFLLAAHLYTYGKIPFDISTLGDLDEGNFEIALTAIRIATRGHTPYKSFSNAFDFGNRL
jgi:hypothetical protein